MAQKSRQLLENAAVFRALIDRSRDAIFITDLETGRFLYVNRPACRGLGYSSAELLSLGVSDIEVTLPDDETWRGHQQELLSTGAMVLEGRHRRKDGSTFPVEVSVQLVELEQSRYLVAVSRDISLRRRDETIRNEYQDFMEDVVRERSAALQQANDALELEATSRAAAQEALADRLRRQQAVAQALEWIVSSASLDEAIDGILGDLGVLSGADRAYLFQYSADQVRMSNTHEWCAPGVPSDRGELQRLPVSAFPWWTARMLLGTPLQVADVATLPAEAAAERALFQAHGIHSLLAIPFFWDEQPAGFIGLDNVSTTGETTSRDLTHLQITTQIVAQGLEKERARSQLAAQEAQYRILVENATDQIFVIDADLRVRSVNGAAARFLRRDAAEVAGKALHELFPPEVAEQFRVDIQRVLASDQAVITQSTIDLGAGTRHLLTTLSPLPRSPAGAPGGVIGVSRDVTEIRTLEQQLRQSQKMDALGRLAGGVAHDFNNLLVLINNYAAFLIEALDEGDPRQEDAVEILKAGERAASLTHQLLAFSRQEVIEPRRMSVHRVVGELERMLRRMLGEDIKLELGLDSPRTQVIASPGAMDQILLNLAINARDAMPGGGTLSIQTREVELNSSGGEQIGPLAPGRYLRLSVADNGTGMSPEVQEHLFEPFYTTKGEGRGTGLGLATVYGIVKQLGGDVQIRSTEGVGTTMVVFLPAVQGTTSNLPTITRPSRTDLTPLSVLLVEDDEKVRRMTARILSSHGFIVQEAADGSEALALAEQPGNIVDLLITDVVMPNLSGPAVAREILNRFPGKPVVFISGYAQSKSLAELMTMPKVRFLPKPFSPTELLSKIDELIGSETRPRSQS